LDEAKFEIEETDFFQNPLLVKPVNRAAVWELCGMLTLYRGRFMFLYGAEFSDSKKTVVKNFFEIDYSNDSYHNLMDFSLDGVDGCIFDDLGSDDSLERVLYVCDKNKLDKFLDGLAREKYDPFEWINIFRWRVFHIKISGRRLRRALDFQQRNLNDALKDESRK
jgi:hypothetical protein